MPQAEPSKSCRKCPRLVAYRKANRAAYPDFHNAPVPTWGTGQEPLLVVGLAPGLKGANKTGRPFTGDASGDLLFASLIRAGLASQTAGEIALHGCAITNAVACVPPENRPTGAEMAACRSFLQSKLSGSKTIFALGKLAHDSVVRALSAPLSKHPFAHGATTEIGDVSLISSYHPSRYNVSTKRINAEMLDAALALALEAVGRRSTGCS